MSTMSSPDHDPELVGTSAASRNVEDDAESHVDRSSVRELDIVTAPASGDSTPINEGTADGWDTFSRASTIVPGATSDIVSRPEPAYTRLLTHTAVQYPSRPHRMVYTPRSQVPWPSSSRAPEENGNRLENLHERDTINEQHGDRPDNDPHTDTDSANTCVAGCRSCMSHPRPCLDRTAEGVGKCLCTTALYSCVACGEVASCGVCVIDTTISCATSLACCPFSCCCCLLACCTLLCE